MSTERCVSFAAALASAAVLAFVQSPLRHSQQLLLVVTGGWDAVSGSLRRFERETPTGRWTEVGAPIAVVVGRRGLGWGAGVADGAANGGPLKTEGDARGPAGAFRIGTAFGEARSRPDGLGLPFRTLDDHVECVDDVQSQHYNQLVTKGAVKTVDWTSSERMWLEPLYRLGVVVEHNTSPIRPGAGSCIFLHAWGTPPSGTDGCTAMAQEHLSALVQWLDAARHPLLVQLPASEWRRLKTAWQLPG